MANLHETAQWETNIYRIELDDPVEGGEDGVDNRPHKALANRTLYLKHRLDELTNNAETRWEQTASVVERLFQTTNLLEFYTGQLEDEIKDLKTQLKKLGVGVVLAYLEVEIVGYDAPAGKNYQIKELGKEGDIGLVGGLGGGYPKNFTVALPADYDESTHRYKITVQPKYIDEKRQGTTRHSVISDTNKRLVINVPQQQYVYHTNRNGDTYGNYLSMTMLIEVTAK